MSSAIVIDASVVVKLFVQEDLSDEAHRLFEDLAAREAAQALDAYAPDFMWAECANALWKYARFYGYSVQDAEDNLRDLCHLAITPVPAGQLLQSDAFRLACTYGITFYDSCYVTLAEDLGARFVTADRKLSQQIGARLPVILLADWTR